LVAGVWEAVHTHPELPESSLRLWMLFFNQLQANKSPTRDKKSKRTPVIAADHIGAGCVGGWVGGIHKFLGGTSKENYRSIHLLEKVSAK